MTSRERVVKALNHEEPDKLPVDLGNSVWTGIHARAVEGLREYYGLEKRPVKVWEPYQFLGELDDDLIRALGVDTAKFAACGTAFGFRNENWKEFKTWWGQEVLVSGNFMCAPHQDDGIVIFPEGDTGAPPSGHMPTGSYYFDTIIRQEEVDFDNLDLEDNVEEFVPVSEEDIEFYKEETKRHLGSDRAPIACFGGTAFGDIFAVPAPWMKYPKGLRDITEWYISTSIRQDYVHKIFEYQCKVALENLARIHEVVGDAITVILTCGADIGTQDSQFCSVKTYESLYAPYLKQVNKWIHENTSWKSMKHSCGAVEGFMESFIDTGFDVINPVQISAKGMDSATLKQRYGDRLVFWGGGVDTQRTLPFGTPEQVREQVLRQCEILAPGGGFVFNTVHNIQANVPVENIAAMVDAIKEFNGEV